MEIKFSNKISKYLKDEKTIKKYYGKISRNIIVSLSVLKHADYLSQVPNVPPTRRHKLNNEKWAVDVSANWRLVFKPLNGTDLDDIDSIEIVDIEDYH